MPNSFYETIRYADPTFLITFHFDRITLGRPIGFSLHWHEHVEILLFTTGGATLQLDGVPIACAAGDVAVINSNVSHQMLEKPVESAYHCLIINKQFCDFFGIPLDSLHVQEHISDERVRGLILSIAKEMAEQHDLYKVRVQAYALELMVLLAREYSCPVALSKASGNVQKQKLIKKSIGYITAHYEELLTVEAISEHVGLSKYYFCRSFKEITGQRVFDYINLMRCTQARRLLGTGQYNISESAYASGFNNLSYFTRTYRRFMGVPPSCDLPRQHNA
ncbi:MAG: AraC family transcriptional regulator [Angelakisella sp.]